MPFALKEKVLEQRDIGMLADVHVLTRKMRSSRGVGSSHLVAGGFSYRMAGGFSHLVVGGFSHLVAGGFSHLVAGGFSHLVVGGFSHLVVGGFPHLVAGRFSHLWLVESMMNLMKETVLFFWRGISDGDCKNSEVVDFRMVTCCVAKLFWSVLAW